MQPVNDDDLAGNKEAEDCVNVMSSKTTTSIGVLRPQSSFSGIKLGYVLKIVDFQRVLSLYD